MVTGHSSTKDVSDQGSMWPAWSRSCKTGVISKAFPWQPQLLQCSPFTMHSRTALRSMRASAARSLRSWRPISVDAMQLNAPLKELVGSCCG
eukprot:symbB.v1.2.040944.t1/scaffold7283.1/size13980/3